MKKIFSSAGLLAILIFSYAAPVWAQEEFQGLENLQESDFTAEEMQAMQQPAEPIEVQTDYFRGEVVEILEDGVIEIGSFRQPYQKVRVEIISGDEQGNTFQHEYQLAENNLEAQKLAVGDKVVVVKVLGNQTQYYIAEPYRVPQVVIVFAIFVFLAIVFAGKKGITSLIGLAFSILVIVQFILPRIIAGQNPVLVSVIGSVGIMVVALYLAHGFNKRTSVALAGTTITLILAALFSVAAVSFARLFGLGSEEAISLLSGNLRNINLQGLYLGGIIIGALGVLDDVTTAQTATVAEIHRANPKLDAKELYKRGHIVGKEHIASLINTLALAYVGASLPLMLIFTQVDFPLWVNLNSEFLVEEIMRTIIGSTALILAVPITTSIAAKVFENEKVDHTQDKEVFHTHAH